MSETRTLHFTLGPVQGFIAQARRTRDLAAGSFILSYLVGCAMNEVLKGGGSIEFPAVHDGERNPTDPLLKAIAAVDGRTDLIDGATLRWPQTGTLPNRFRASIPEDFDPKRCADAVTRAWRKIANAVFGEYIKPIQDKGNGTQDIWNRQVDGFWEIAWVIGDSDDLLDRRKKWRSHVPTKEPGDKCTIMGNLQELSGFVRARERANQDAFWSAVRSKAQPGDIREDERLCAISFIKRFLCRVGKEAIGWDLEPSYPSTVYMSVVHWLEKVMKERDKRDLIRQFVEEARQVERVFPREWGRRELSCIKCIRDVANGDDELIEFAGISPSLFFDSFYVNNREWKDGHEDAKEKLLRILKGLYGRDASVKPSPFYAVLVMDGDNMGALLRKARESAGGDSKGASLVSQALLKFGDGVDKIVSTCNGVVVYSGGDDVLAFLPVEDALKAACKLRRAYLEAFASKLPQGTGLKSTISAAIVYAHCHTPLQRVIRSAHHLLNHVAKKRTGRDALAIKVWKAAGSVVEWSAPWSVVLDTGGGMGSDATVFDELVDSLGAGAGSDKKLATSFFYNVRHRFALLGYDEGDEDSTSDPRTGGKAGPKREGRGGDRGAEEEEQALLAVDPVKLLTAEYLKSREIKASREEAEEMMQKLLKLCRRAWHDGEGNVCIDDVRVDMSGALLVKFLATKGVGE